MKRIRLTSWLAMLLLSGGVMAQEQFFDDIYYSGSNKEKEKTEEAEAQDEVVGEEETLQTTSYETSASDTDEWDVDAYNRRYSPDEAYAEEASLGEDQIVERTQTSIEEEPERRSDLEYTERIIRYHSPSKISIVGADQVDLYLDDGYYAYDYGTDYSDGYTNVSVNLNFGSPWYSWGWYDPWYRPWGYYSSWWYRPYYWGWGGWYAGWYDPWFDPWWGPSWSWGGW